MKIINILFLWLIGSSILYGQKTEEIFKSELFTDSSVAFVLGESHFDDDWFHQFSFIRTLNEKYSITKIGLESPIAYEKYYNDYLLNGDEFIFELMNCDHKLIFRTMKKLMMELRRFNLSVNKSRMISVFCYNLPRDDFKSNLILFEKLFFDLKDHEEINFDSIVFVKKRKIKKKDARIIINNLVKDYEINKEVYNHILGDRIDIFQLILNGLQDVFDKNYMFSEESIIKREIFMLREIKKQLLSEERIILLIGNNHASKLLNDSEAYGKPFNSVISLLNQEYQGKVFSIITQYVKRRRLFSFLNETNFLNVNPRDYFRRNDSRYKVFSSEDLITHVEASKRCDLLLLYDTRCVRW